jgi:hypothetical protein
VHQVRQLPGYALDMLSLMAMAFLTAFSVGYSLFIGSMTSGGGVDAAVRFAALSGLFAILSALFSVLILLGLSRRELWRDGTLPPARLGAFIGVAIGLFLAGRLLEAIWPLVVFGFSDVDPEWYVLALRLPAAVLQVLLFPVLVWQVALARGGGRPTFRESWSCVWSNPAVMSVVLVLAVVWLGPTVLAQSILTQDSLPREIGLFLFLVPSAIAHVLTMLLAIIVCRDLARDGREAEVFR